VNKCTVQPQESNLLVAVVLWAEGMCGMGMILSNARPTENATMKQGMQRSKRPLLWATSMQISSQNSAEAGDSVNARSPTMDLTAHLSDARCSAARLATDRDAAFRSRLMHQGQTLMCHLTQLVCVSVSLPGLARLANSSTAPTPNCLHQTSRPPHLRLVPPELVECLLESLRGCGGNGLNAQDTGHATWKTLSNPQALLRAAQCILREHVSASPAGICLRIALKDVVLSMKEQFATTRAFASRTTSIQAQTQTLLAGARALLLEALREGQERQSRVLPHTTLEGAYSGAGVLRSTGEVL